MELKEIASGRSASSEISFGEVIRSRVVVSWLLILTLVFGSVSCGSSQKKLQQNFEQNLNEGSCEKALETLPQEDATVKFVGRTQQMTTTVFSYALTGASYTAEVLWDVAGGTIMVVGLCAPLVAASVAANNNGGGEVGPMVSCLPGQIDALSAPPLGRRTYRGTRGMRCPDLAPLSQSLRQVATCYEKRGDVESYKKAHQSLISIRKSSEFYECLPQDEQAAVHQQIDVLAAKIPQ